MTAAEPKTAAMVTFEKNLDSVHHLLSMSGRETIIIRASAKRTKAVTDAVIPKVTSLRAAGAPIGRELRKLERSIDSLNSRVDKGVERLLTAALWEVVILVTAAEAYLHDVLKSAAKIDPSLMEKSQQPIRYADVVHAGSIEELADEMRSRWARGWVDDGGPTRWISRLEKMGARGFATDLPPQLERIWGIRHVVVHSAGVATPDFVRHHPGVVVAVGDRVRVSTRDIGAFAKQLGAFVEPVEEYVLKRYPALNVTPRIKMEKGDIQ
jgi:hypothetical protein